MSASVRGSLHLYSETGTEGGYWAIHDRNFITHGSQGEQWSYEGLHTLQDGDILSVFDKVTPEEIVWQGLIRLVPHDPTQKLNHPYRLHHDQAGVDQNEWATWFIGEYPGVVVRPTGFPARAAHEPQPLRQSTT